MRIVLLSSFSLNYAKTHGFNDWIILFSLLFIVVMKRQKLP